ncbi:MAG TPA: hypothetical protein VGX91_10805 [Candidatus Cybelea sp.]|jgi:hypothetical protein|nr:hypothetical protein [Candidatus Cybelea sp.]
MVKNLHRRIALAAVATLVVAGCGGQQSNLVPGSSMSGAAVPQTGILTEDDTSILKTDKKQVEIGSTIDPKFGQLNPYGLTVAPATAGDFTKGDLVVCNFNAKGNVQGTGFTVVALHPKPGSKPLLVSASKTLKGCASLALSTGDDIWASAFSANDEPIISPNGKSDGALKGKPYDRPWGQAFAQPNTGSPAFYESNAADGTIVRINLSSGFPTDVIAKGFAVNHGKPGSIFGPSGLTYDPTGDVLYIVDGTNDTVVSFSNVSSIPTGGITVGKSGKTFSGPNASDAKLVFSGSPLNGPISAALLPNHNLILGNTGNPSGENIMVEITPSGKLLATRNVDKGASGSLFGIVATGTNDTDTKVYFNDDNDNDLRVLEK